MVVVLSDLLSSSAGVSSVMGTLEMNASSTLATLGPPPPPSFRLTVMADRSNEILRSESVSLNGNDGVKEVDLGKDAEPSAIFLLD